MKKAIGILVFLPLLSWAEHGPEPSYCEKTLGYDIFYGRQLIGSMERHLMWQGLLADIHSTGELSVAFFKGNGEQNTRIYWSTQQRKFLTKQFSRQVRGFNTSSTEAKFSPDGKVSTVTHQGKQSEYKETEGPIVDVEALVSQMRQHLISGDNKFDFRLQQPKKISHYYFAVQSTEKLSTHFGKLNTVKVVQTNKTDRQLILWFSPELDYQLVKAHYLRNILDIRGELVSQTTSCNSTRAAFNKRAKK